MTKKYEFRYLIGMPWGYRLVQEVRNDVPIRHTSVYHPSDIYLLRNIFSPQTHLTFWVESTYLNISSVSYNSPVKRQFSSVIDRACYLFGCQCYAPCDKDGVKYRILQCVWYGTKKPAGTACRDQPRPAVMRTCRGLPCSEGKYCCILQVLIIYTIFEELFSKVA